MEYKSRNISRHFPIIILDIRSNKNSKPDGSSSSKCSKFLLRILAEASVTFVAQRSSYIISETTTSTYVRSTILLWKHFKIYVQQLNHCKSCDKSHCSQEVFVTYFKVESGGVELRSIDVMLPSASDVTAALSSSSIVNAKGESYSVISLVDKSIVVAVDTFSVTLSVEVAVTDAMAMELSLRNTFIEENSNVLPFNLFISATFQVFYFV